MKDFKNFFETNELEEDDIDEQTTASIGVGKYSSPLQMQKRKKEIDLIHKQCANIVNTMKRYDMLRHTRRMGLTLGHLKDDDIRKTILAMSLRNKRKFMGVANGTGSGDPNNDGVYK